ncbi:Nnf1-domain-containing protein [Lepidopterella palustris CBS 459.81]|uniref:Nnf1-domain-containing protein n=1 Tax=Lepidopterella palustris CBS 459.81 TaxID=1314670 RepID=A0A8E2EKZ5_9PEZI|nr:Nnf1-domain-containing protein [Lepidopterella palustris CBS 459.81]
MPAAANPSSRSPSPPAPPPLAESPGPRATALINVFNNALEATLRKCSYSSFAACFPTPAKYVPESLDALWRDFTGKLGQVWKAEFDNILTERKVVQSLNSLDQCIADAKNRKERAELNTNGGPVEVPVPPHTLPPSSLRLAHLIPFLEQHSALLNSQLSATQTANTELLSAITAQRAEIEALVRSLDKVVHDLETSAQMMGQDEVQSLSAEIREIEEDMKSR